MFWIHVCLLPIHFLSLSKLYGQTKRGAPNCKSISSRIQRKIVSIFYFFNYNLVQVYRFFLFSLKICYKFIATFRLEFYIVHSFSKLLCVCLCWYYLMILFYFLVSLYSFSFCQILMIDLCVNVDLWMLRKLVSMMILFFCYVLSTGLGVYLWILYSLIYYLLSCTYAFVYLCVMCVCVS